MVGSILNYALAVGITLILALSTIAAEQSKATVFTMDTNDQLLDYCAMHPTAKIRYKNLIRFLIFTLIPHTLVHLRLKAMLQGPFPWMATRRQTTNKIIWTHIIILAHAYWVQFILCQHIQWLKTRFSSMSI